MFKAITANERYAAGKYHHRSVAVLSECDYCLFIHDGVSSGTINEYKLAIKLHVKHEYHVVKSDMAIEPIYWQLELPENT